MAAGRVSLEWVVTKEGGKQKVSLLWREHGGPAVSAPLRRGFGTKVISASVEQTLNGKLNPEFRSEGFVSSIELFLSQSDIDMSSNQTDWQ